ncbi:hypothetical protein PHYBLDRAFT_166806 [Phycomyces blakesleeanus NRRL 1555(-)]|uniref:Uncharacterized protein n=1 Tax=Phycomyces blakesleeanus (strain ATCC 8743b / DSM 1359 / FGSC 10004 / NBRC 33097 / NRRL 1555) TaxID=763407 RepID=A0A167NB91_PHYB8|nr:hypothetical protein PHYBLDRAFT_166806 [Phycomyces blakesleeanus NRRL 1555(-)]OAD75574.1 hypothetical protein PHYBLDRAFT_166806 [Phycomyces blakesleeanus NRRL 1555(-)]|eukprot:XP_018293614.1 hypothetical protein PHYBLDRAFT_166806 [Phycomyces blakesleeanus NRRL 1555(-)]
MHAKPVSLRTEVSQSVNNSSMNIDSEFNDTEEYIEDFIDEYFGNHVEELNDLSLSADNDIFFAQNDNDNNDNNSIDLDFFKKLKEESQEFDEDPTHAFIVSFAAFFISKYVVDSGSVLLLKFINEMLAHFGQSFHLPLSLSGLNSMTEVNLLAGGVHYYVACSKCNTIYLESESFPECCAS